MSIKTHIMVALVVLLTGSISAEQPSVSVEIPPLMAGPTGIDDKPAQLINVISISTGIERLNYKESEPDTQTFSDAEVLNYVTMFDAFQEYESVLIGFKGVIPSSNGADTESWDYGGIKPYQLNTLKYGWMRIDGYLGYRFDEDVFSGSGIWYGGLRYADAKQARYDFYVSGVYQNITEVTERIKSYSFLLGYKGNVDLVADKQAAKPVLKGFYGVEGALPIYNKVTNSRIPEITFHETLGYSIDVKASLEYLPFGDTVAVNLGFYGGILYWAGSDWETTSSGGKAKWPENKTIYSGGNLGLVVTF
ncbi:MAG: hypothetical protein HY762_05635 [Planctomycetes bacterium]|nr:hypothetical protein [Planctomycetota bacterium]